MHDPYDDQLLAARYRAERDQAMQECDRLRARLRDSVPRVAYERKRAAWLRHIRECEGALGRRNRRIAEDRDEVEWVLYHGGLDVVEARWDNDTQLADAVIHALWPCGMPDGGGNEDVMDELGKRLMPEGHEWLRYESGEQVRFGDKFLDHQGNVRSVLSVNMFQEGGFQIGTGQGTYDWHSAGERVKRPAVLAADNEPLEVGQTVWDANGDELVVVALEDGGNTVTCRYADVGDGIPVHGMWSPSDLTHQRPVPDAHGVPIKMGDTVWDTDAESDTPLTVVEVSSDLVRCEYTWKDGKTYRPCYPPSVLTHTKPEPRDSWEKYEEKLCYLLDDGDLASKMTERAKALAERGQ